MSDMEIYDQLTVKTAVPGLTANRVRSKQFITPFIGSNQMRERLGQSHVPVNQWSVESAQGSDIRSKRSSLEPASTVGLRHRVSSNLATLAAMHDRHPDAQFISRQLSLQTHGFCLGRMKYSQRHRSTIPLRTFLTVTVTSFAPLANVIGTAKPPGTRNSGSETGPVVRSDRAAAGRK